MDLRDIRRAGHWPTLLCSSLYLGVSSMIWVLVGVLANAVDVELPMSSLQKGLLVGTPILGGAILCLPFGLLADRIGARRTAIIGMMLTIVPLVLGWLWADSFTALLVVGSLLGVAGSSYAVALPLASRWYGPQQQGFALGIAGAGYFGTSLAALFGPFLAEMYDWHAVFGFAIVPLVVGLGLFVRFARDCPSQPAPRRFADYLAVLRLRDTWYLCFFYAVTFGGFIGMIGFVGVYFREHYHLTTVQAGVVVGVCAFAGPLLRPVGGYLADRFGSISLLTAVYSAAGIVLLDLATAPPMFWGVILFVTLMALFGVGNGAVFQLVPQRFPREVGAVTGVVAAIGCVGGFFLPTLFGGVYQLTGSYTLGFVFIALMSLGCVAVLFQISYSWDGIFITKEGLAATTPGQASHSTIEPEMAGSRIV